jgi:endogenous inhibitor of DNA gyrase (YacG/DUF329 family)
MILPDKTKVIAKLKEAGLDEVQIEKEIARLRSRYAAKIDENLLYFLLAKERGIPVSIAEATRVPIRDLMPDMNEITVCGYVLDIWDGETRSKQPKKGMRIMDRTGQASVSIWGEDIEKVPPDLKFGDYVELIGVRTFKPARDRMVLTPARRFSLKKVDNRGIPSLAQLTHQDISEVHKTRDIVSVMGIVTDVSENRYIGCPSCGKGIRNLSEIKHECPKCGRRIESESDLKQYPWYRVTLISTDGMSSVSCNVPPFMAGRVTVPEERQPIRVYGVYDKERSALQTMHFEEAKLDKQFEDYFLKDKSLQTIRDRAVEYVERYREVEREVLEDYLRKKFSIKAEEAKRAVSGALRGHRIRQRRDGTLVAAERKK